MVLSDFRIDILIDKNKNNENQKNRGEEVIMIDDEVKKFERVEVLEVLRRGYLKNKRELLEPIHDKRNLRKILFTGWHDHFIDHKYYFLRFLAAHTSSLFNLTQMNHVVICSTKLANHHFKRRNLHEEFAAYLHETLYENIHPISKVIKIFHIPWRCLPKNLGLFSFWLVLPLSEISFKHNYFLGPSIKKMFI